MTFSISGVLSGQPASTYTPEPTTSQQAPQPPPQPSGDSVTLSQSAQVSQLNMQGQSSTEIAEALGISVSVVDSDLGIVAANFTSSPASVAATTAASATSTQSTSAVAK
jgi:DNA-binding CsgD family transcriptional regulator